MAETPAAAPGGVAVSGHDVLLATKLHLPRPRPGFVPRPRLVSRLDEGLDRGLVLVCAPAGYGKTVALADWARRSGRPVAWLSLDAGDNDPVRFWRYVVAAVGPARPGVAGRLLPLFGPPPPSSVDHAREVSDAASTDFSSFRSGSRPGSEPLHANIPVRTNAAPNRIMGPAYGVRHG